MIQELECTLRQAPLFSQLTRAQLQRVILHAHLIQLNAGQSLFYQDDRAAHFYFVVTGQIRLFRLSEAGDEKIIELISAGQTFAEALLFMGTGCYPVGAAALLATEVLAIDNDDFAAMLRESTDTCFALLATLSQRLHALIAEIDNLTLHSASSRVAYWLLAQLNGDQQEVTLDVPKAVLASRLSIKPETWSRITRRFTEQGLITVTGQHIRVCDPVALRRLVAQDLPS
ncbi:Crp/Fnr family transcriptional regulator [Thiospirillum jenense]|uniref:Crp/Fnr family transcriptional regulator n=1 Tax=Thiospirillum jenense TaxID=1653858 RepID=A0A839HEJ9_9GAMM|nr:Crp/Fnr family transcriptional regulator [Thiospirillum jenense]MBB1125668.1 Crp/Fnr family transcriptional regulator [Thiospirillum jenense]